MVRISFYPLQGCHETRHIFTLHSVASALDPEPAFFRAAPPTTTTTIRFLAGKIMSVITQEAYGVHLFSEEKISGAVSVGKFNSPPRQGHSHR